MSFFAGFAEGFSGARQRKQQSLLQKEQLGLQREKMQLQRDQLDMQKQAFQMQQQSQQQAQEINNQFKSVVQEHGITAGIEFLKVHRPKEGLAYEKVIADTKKSIAETAKTNAETQGLKLDNKKKIDEVVQGSINIIAGFGSQLQKAPEQDREALYQAMLPKLKMLDSNIPEDYERGKVYLQGAVALAVPQNRIYEEQQKLLRTQSDIIKAIDYEQRHPNLTKKQKEALASQRDKLIVERVEAEEKRVRAELQLTQNKEDKLRGEYTKLTKGYQDAVLAATKASKALSLGTAAGDHAAIFAYMKIVDKGARVTDDDYANVQNAGGVRSWIRKLYNDAVDGQKMSPRMREQFKVAVSKMLEAETEMYERTREKYIKIATDRGLNLERTLPDYRQAKNQKAIETLQKAIPEELLPQAKAALERGASPQEIIETFQQMKRGGQ